MHPWAFRTRLRRAAFGWKRSKLAIERIHEALAEIRAVARQDAASAAEGAVLFLDRISPALSLKFLALARGAALASPCHPSQFRPFRAFFMLEVVVTKVC